MIRVVHPGSRIRMLTFYPSWIPDPGVKKAPNPGSGSATLASAVRGEHSRKEPFKQLVKNYSEHLHMSARPVENARDKIFIVFLFSFS
jgi:hypothetical protein